MRRVRSAFGITHSARALTATSLALLLATTACGRSRREIPRDTAAAGADNPAGESGGASNGGASSTASDGGATSTDGGATATDGGATSTDGEFSACVSFVRAVCNKLFYECRGAENVAEPCAPSVDSSCPNRYFSPAATATSAELVSCAAQWRDASCDDLRAGIRPDCVPHGVSADGAACVFGAECASGYCAAGTAPDGTPSCGSCVPVAREGDDCSQGDVHCDDGLECRGTCVPAAPFGLPPGAECDALNQCTSGYFCLELPGDDGPRCEPPPEVGEACPLDTPFCTGNCDADSVCEAAPGVGSPCALGGTDAHVCSFGLRCDLTAPNVPTCAPPLGLGDPCRPLNADFSSGGCESGTLCHCDDSACESGTCVKRRDEGAACDGAHDVCMAGTRCDGGVCKAFGLQPRFASACND